MYHVDAETDPEGAAEWVESKYAADVHLPTITNFLISTKAPRMFATLRAADDEKFTLTLDVPKNFHQVSFRAHRAEQSASGFTQPCILDTAVQAICSPCAVEG